jgi:RNA polymerase sigma factor (sigma-70 family)
VLRHEQDAEDAFQAAFLVLARKAGSIRQGEAVGGWLYQVAYRLALRARAVCDRRREQLTTLCDAFETPGPAPPQDLLQGSLEEELQRLPEQYRSAVVLCYFEGRTQTEAARLLATTSDAVNSRLKRARTLLRQRLTRRGCTLSSVAVVGALAANAARAALAPPRLTAIVRTALHFARGLVPACGASARAAALAQGALRSMIPPKSKILLALALFITLLTTGALLIPVPVLGDDPTTPVARGAAPKSPPATDKPVPPPVAEKPGPQPDPKAKARRACILLWMSGGPSQIDTFDLKPGQVNGGEFKAIDTAAKGIQISEHLPRLAKLANHLAIIRSLTHSNGDHTGAAHLMRTGHAAGGIDYPALGCVLAKELGGPRDLPRYVSLLPGAFSGGPGYGPGFLRSEYAPLTVGGLFKFGRATDPDEVLQLPPAATFEKLVEGEGEKMRKAVAKAFYLAEEKPEVRDAYGRTPFGQGCLLARRLIERGVPVVEVTLSGWDTHADNFNLVKKLSGTLDAGWAALLKDLHERKRLDTTLIVWMGEFGRTPHINANNGRDHYPRCCAAVLAGCGIKGGQAIGKTSADGVDIEERPVTPPELLATVYQALGIDAAKTHKDGTGQQVPLVEKGTKAVKEALR